MAWKEQGPSFTIIQVVADWAIQQSNRWNAALIFESKQHFGVFCKPLNNETGGNIKTVIPKNY
jgi:hypothetical protein